MRTRGLGIAAAAVLLITGSLLAQAATPIQPSIAMQLRAVRRSNEAISATIEIMDGIEFIGSGAGELISVTGTITAESANGPLSAMKIRLVSGAVCESGKVLDSIGYLDRFAWLPFNPEIEVPYRVLLGFQRVVAVVKLRDVIEEESVLFCDVVVVEGRIPFEPTSGPSATATPTPDVKIEPIVVLPLLGQSWPIHLESLANSRSP